MQEPELIAGLNARNESAFKWLVENYRNRLYAVVLNILQNEEDAEDVLQDTFIKVFDAINGFKQQSSLSTWMHQIAVRKCVDKLRRKNTRNKVLAWLPAWMPHEKPTVENEFYHPGIPLENKEKNAELFKAIKALPNNQKIAFTLIKIEGIKYEEACQIMNLGTKAIESLVSRAKQNLQKKLSHLKN